MATKTASNKATMEEFNIVEDEIFDLATNGKPYDLLTCPRCGGTLVVRGDYESHFVRCETDGCIKYGVRGI